MNLKRMIKTVKLENVELKNVEVDVLDTKKPETDHNFEQQLKSFKKQSRANITAYNDKQYAGKKKKMKAIRAKENRSYNQQ